MPIPFRTITTNRLVSRLATLATYLQRLYTTHQKAPFLKGLTNAPYTITQEYVFHVQRHYYVTKPCISLHFFFHRWLNKKRINRLVPFHFLAMKKYLRGIVLPLANVNAYIVSVFHTHHLFRQMTTQIYRKHKPTETKRNEKTLPRLFLPVPFIKNTAHKQRRKQPIKNQYFHNNLKFYFN